NFDHELGLNFYDPATVAMFFAQFRGVHLANIAKSHHAFAFFESVIEEVTSDFHIFYVYRDRATLWSAIGSSFATSRGMKGQRRGRATSSFAPSRAAK